jgi:hypothetical protein
MTATALETAPAQVEASTRRATPARLLRYLGMPVVLALVVAAVAGYVTTAELDSIE